MKTSWFIFVGMVYIAIQYFSGVAEYANNINGTVASQVQALQTPTGTNYFSAAASAIVFVWDYIVIVIKWIFLWNPTLWSGNWIYFYYCVCMPICIALIISIVFVMRGVHNS